MDQHYEVLGRRTKALKLGLVQNRILLGQRGGSLKQTLGEIRELKKERSRLAQSLDAVRRELQALSDQLHAPDLTAAQIQEGKKFATNCYRLGQKLAADLAQIELLLIAKDQLRTEQERELTRVLRRKQRLEEKQTEVSQQMQGLRNALADLRQTEGGR